MDSRNLATNAQNMPAGIRSDMPEEKGQNGPSLSEIHERAREIHIERGSHVCDMDNYLDEWLQAELELKKKYNTSNDEGTKRLRLISLHRPRSDRRSLLRARSVRPQRDNGNGLQADSAPELSQSDH